MKRLVLAVLVVAVAIGAALWFGYDAVRVNQARRDMRQNRQPPPAKTMTLFGTRIAGRRDGKPFWHFSAERVEQGLEGGATTFFGIYDGSIYRDGQPYLSFSADRAVYDPKTEEIHIFGNLVATFPEGTLRSEEAIWSIRSETLRVNTPVQVAGKGFTLTAGAMEVDLQAELARFTKGVVLDQERKGVVRAEFVTKSLRDGMFEIPGPFTLEVEIEDDDDSEDEDTD